MPTAANSRANFNQALLILATVNDLISPEKPYVSAYFIKNRLPEMRSLYRRLGWLVCNKLLTLQHRSANRGMFYYFPVSYENSLTRLNNLIINWVAPNDKVKGITDEDLQWMAKYRLRYQRRREQHIALLNLLNPGVS